MAAWILGLRLPAFPVAFSGSTMGRAADCPLCSSFWNVARVCSAALCTASLACGITQQLGQPNMAIAHRQSVAHVEQRNPDGSLGSS